MSTHFPPVRTGPESVTVAACVETLLLLETAVPGAATWTAKPARKLPPTRSTRISVLPSAVAAKLADPDAVTAAAMPAAICVAVSTVKDTLSGSAPLRVRVRVQTSPCAGVPAKASPAWWLLEFAARVCAEPERVTVAPNSAPVVVMVRVVPATLAE